MDVGHSRYCLVGKAEILDEEKNYVPWIQRSFQPLLYVICVVRLFIEHSRDIVESSHRGLEHGL